jgi:hypothetical protein
MMKQRIITYKTIVNQQTKYHAAKYKISASVRGTNSGHEPQLVQERSVIWFSYTVNSYRHCKNDVESPTSTTMWHHANIRLELYLF